MQSTTLFRRVVGSRRPGIRLFGTSGFKQNLFNPTETHVELRNMLKAFAAKEVRPQALEYDKHERFNVPLFRRLGSECGILGITVPEKFGGVGLDAVATVIANEEICTADPGFGLSYLAHSLLFANNLARNGNDEQRARFLPGASSGELIGAMGMSEPGVGTDVLALKTKAEKKGDNYVISGRKMWITNGTIGNGETCDAVLVYAKTGPKEISLFIVEKGMPGFSVGTQIHGKLGMRASPTAELVFDNVVVPKANLVGHEGDAIKHMMRNLEIERLGLAAMSLGIAKRSLEIMINYSNERKCFGHSISHFGQIQTHIATSFSEYMAAKAYVYHTASELNLDNESSTRLNSDGVKLVAGRTGKDIADRAIQCLGGNGYVAEYEVERLWRDAKLLEIGGGTNEAHQKNITKDISKLSQVELQALLDAS